MYYNFFALAPATHVRVQIIPVAVLQITPPFPSICARMSKPLYVALARFHEVHAVFRCHFEPVVQLRQRLSSLFACVRENSDDQLYINSPILLQ